jgi:hypothetical protein
MYRYDADDDCRASSTRCLFVVINVVVSHRDRHEAK